jgi:protein-S-isoprenylcysteine O-methyltransferase Ste14
MGVAGLVECFGRFALKGHRTPTPIAPSENLVVSRIYRHVRNPMYVVVVCAIVGAGIGSFRH